MRGSPSRAAWSVLPGTNLTPPLYALLGILWIGLGLVLPRVRRNPVLGVRTAWTLTSDENWARTHRVAGYAMVFGGLACVLVGGLGRGPAPASIALAALVGSALVPVIYSVFLGRRLESERR